MRNFNSEAVVGAGLWIIATVCLLLGMLSMFGVIKISADDGTKFLLGLAVVIGVVLIFRDRLTKIVLPGGITAELSAVKKSVQDVAAAAEELKSRQTEIAAPQMAVPAPIATTRTAFPEASIVDPEDRNKGQFGGEAEKDGLRLSATVQPSDVRPGWFRIDLAVTGVARKLVEPVEFHLHETFAPSVQPISPVNNQARLTVLAWGAFTVGAVANHGNTLLELDLSADVTFPKAFRDA
ncbi:pYEATS domain-containing protein [uncultured Bradyrhizobium sp.]|uniref:pYEATS domain-containing protein n=1 Tax=uncultured Bradyrhizobium sp. TaxID=199684 RepID=UPI00261FA4B7|nr:pYEATS domain-containing protein [uncultured Bradyrhizobium sp.]